MGKSILMSIQPKWVAKILNGEKTIEVRKKFPKDYVGWVYIYCTKDQGRYGETQLLYNFKTEEYFIGKDLDNHNPNDICYLNQNGKVVARFWCDKVEEIKVYNGFEVNIYQTEKICPMILCKKSCLTQADFERYLGNKDGYAIHITRLEIFDKPRQLDYYGHKNCKTCIANNGCSLVKKIVDRCGGLPLERAPQSWCYVEGE